MVECYNFVRNFCFYITDCFNVSYGYTEIKPVYDENESLLYAGFEDPRHPAYRYADCRDLDLETEENVETHSISTLNIVE